VPGVGGFQRELAAKRPGLDKTTSHGHRFPARPTRPAHPDDGHESAECQPPTNARHDSPQLPRAHCRRCWRRRLSLYASQSGACRQRPLRRGLAVAHTPAPQPPRTLRAPSTERASRQEIPMWASVRGAGPPLVRWRAPVCNAPKGLRTPCTCWSRPAIGGRRRRQPAAIGGDRCRPTRAYCGGRSYRLAPPTVKALGI
jgi:hypothetical protein